MVASGTGMKAADILYGQKTMLSFGKRKLPEIFSATNTTESCSLIKDGGLSKFGNVN